ncbi:MAG TPA: NAD(P)-binding domain-containing protein [Candidatus Limnocylindrales bacterium]|nr:NAD(P)-binding domain-containing protein [Candidatus Limnocylindrales bacterium]
MTTAAARVCVIGAGPCGLAAVKNLLAEGVSEVTCFEESDGIGGNWAFTDDPLRASVHECTHTISSRRLSSFEDFPMPNSYPDFPSHRQMHAYFSSYANAFRLWPHIRLGSRVVRCTPHADGRWTVQTVQTTETFDWLLVCNGHHRLPFFPWYPGSFAGQTLHSSTYKRPEPFRDRRVLVVGSGNSAADIAVDVSRFASHTALSVREGTYFVPKLAGGRPVDDVFAFWAGKLPKPLLRLALRLWLRLAVGGWSRYGLPRPTQAPLVKPPTVNSAILEALRHGRIGVRPAISHFDADAVHFTDGTREGYDTVIMATGFRPGFPFLPKHITATPLYLRMMHPWLPSLYFIGLFQPIGCVWRLADHQARIAARQIAGRLPRRPDMAERLSRELEVDYRDFHRALQREFKLPRS